MAKIVEVCRPGDTAGIPFQLPMTIEPNLVMVAQFSDDCRACATAQGRQVSSYSEFCSKYDLLTQEELSQALRVPTKDILSDLGSSVPCVGCRKSVDGQLGQIVEYHHATLDPLRIDKDSTMFIRKEVLGDPKKLHRLFTTHGGKLNLVVDSFPKSHKSKRCTVHSLEMHKTKSLGFVQTFLNGVWHEVWHAMNKDCREEVTIIDFSNLFEALDDYLHKHRFCSECKNKVLRAYRLLIKEETINTNTNSGSNGNNTGNNTGNNGNNAGNTGNNTGNNGNNAGNTGNTDNNAGNAGNTSVVPVEGSNATPAVNQAKVPVKTGATPVKAAAGGVASPVKVAAGKAVVAAAGGGAAGSGTTAAGGGSTAAGGVAPAAGGGAAAAGTGTGDKGCCYNPALYAKISACTNDMHIHVECTESFVRSLITRAEPELKGSGNGRERHAKTLDVAQEEVLTCIGVLLYDRLYMIWQRLKTEEQAWLILYHLSIDMMQQNFELAIEKKSGMSRLERICLELIDNEQLQEQRRQNKRQKRKKNRSAITTAIEEPMIESKAVEMNGSKPCGKHVKPTEPSVEGCRVKRVIGGHVSAGKGQPGAGRGQMSASCDSSRGQADCDKQVKGHASADCDKFKGQADCGKSWVKGQADCDKQVKGHVSAIELEREYGGRRNSSVDNNNSRVRNDCPCLSQSVISNSSDSSGASSLTAGPRLDDEDDLCSCGVGKKLCEGGGVKPGGCGGDCGYSSGLEGGEASGGQSSNDGGSSDTQCSETCFTGCGMTLDEQWAQMMADSRRRTADDDWSMGLAGLAGSAGSAGSFGSVSDFRTEDERFRSKLSLLDMLRTQGSSISDDDDDGPGISEADIASFQSNRSALESQRTQLRERLRQDFMRMTQRSCACAPELCKHRALNN